MSSLDDLAIYFFIRGDLREEDQVVQFGHAMFEMVSQYEPAFAKYRIVGLDGGSSEKTFNRTRQKLNNHGIAHVEYTDLEGLRSSEKEHSTFSREAAGSIPAASSSINCS